MIRNMVVRFAAWSMRRGLTEDELRGALIRCFPHRDITWRTTLVEDAQARNAQRRALIP